MSELANPGDARCCGKRRWACRWRRWAWLRARPRRPTCRCSSEQDPAARAVHYVEDASRAEGAASGADCSNCSIYSASPATRRAPARCSRASW